MGTLTQPLRTILAVVAFFAMVYLAYLCMCLAPTARLRRWGTTTSWLLATGGDALLPTGDRY